MGKKLSHICILVVLVMIGFANLANGQSNTVWECRTPAGVHKPSAQWEETYGGITYSCVCSSTKGTICEPKSSGFSSSSPSKNIPSSKQMQNQMFQGLMAPIFGALGDMVYQSMMNLLMPNSSNLAQDQYQEEQQRKEFEAKIAAYNKWIMMQAEAEQKRLAEEAEKKKKGEEILAKASIGGGGELRMESIGGGGLAPLN